VRYLTPITRIVSTALLALALVTSSGLAITATAAAAPSTTHQAKAPKHHKKKKHPQAATAAASGDFCTLMGNEQNEIEKLIANSDSADVLQNLAGRAQDDAKKIESAAPAQIKDDVATMAQASLDEIAALQKADFDFTKIDQSALAALASPTITTATQHVTAYVKNACGIDLSAGLDTNQPNTGSTP
jgi:hypothetical protein